LWRSAGAATGPKAIMESITDGRSAAAEIASALSRLEPLSPVLSANGCRLCQPQSVGGLQ
jgi:heterodisulfide reductase subunit A-like polyferredoxin